MWEPWGLNIATTLLVAAIWSLGATGILCQYAPKLVHQISPRLNPQNGLLAFSNQWPVWLINLFLSLLIAWLFGPAPVMLALITFNSVIVTLGWIDAKTGLLPDRLTLTLLWSGLFVNLNGTIVPLQDAVLGAAGGYLWLWLTYHVFFLVTGKSGIGQGDFKLLAALGAWMGWIALPWILLAASILALVLALTMKARGTLKHGQAISFGPHLAAGGVLVMLYMLV